jgi:hypothetical protein
LNVLNKKIFYVADIILWILCNCQDYEDFEIHFSGVCYGIYDMPVTYNNKQYMFQSNTYIETEEIENKVMKICLNFLFKRTQRKTFALSDFMETN